MATGMTYEGVYLNFFDKRLMIYLMYFVIISLCTIDFKSLNIKLDIDLEI